MAAAAARLLACSPWLCARLLQAQTSSSFALAHKFHPLGPAGSGAGRWGRRWRGGSLAINNPVLSGSPAMASTSAGDAETSTSARRSTEQALLGYDDVLPPVSVKLRDRDYKTPNGVKYGDLLHAVDSNEVQHAKRLAKSLTETAGMGLDAAVLAIDAAEADIDKDYKSHRQGPLHLAAHISKKMCKLLVKDYNCNVNLEDHNGATPLHYAVQGEGHQDIVRFLVNFGADPNKATKIGSTPLHSAADRGYCEIAEYLLSKGALVDPLLYRDAESPLHFAARGGHAKMVNLLLGHGAEHDRRSANRHTPLVSSLAGSSLECLKILIKAGADVNTSSPLPPLSLAADKGLADCITVLLQSGANPNVADKDGKLPIEIATFRGHEECNKILQGRTQVLKKYENLSFAQMTEQEIKDCQLEALTDAENGDVAYLNNNYATALRCYTKALRFGNKDPTLFAKRALCYLGTRDESRYLFDALAYMKLMDENTGEDLNEDVARAAAKKMVLIWYGLETKAIMETDRASREEHP